MHSHYDLCNFSIIVAETQGFRFNFNYLLIRPDEYVLYR
jgi:hypothetical protein